MRVLDFYILPSDSSQIYSLLFMNDLRFQPMWCPTSANPSHRTHGADGAECNLDQDFLSSFLTLSPFFSAAIWLGIICNLGSSVWHRLHLETRFPSEEGAPLAFVPDQQMSTSSSVLWYHLNQAAVVWKISSLLMRDELHHHNRARVWMHSGWPCFMEQISAVFLFVFSCLLLLSMQPYPKSLVTEMGPVLVLSLKFVLLFVSYWTAASLLCGYVITRRIQIQEKAGKLNWVSGCQS